MILARRIEFCVCSLLLLLLFSVHLNAQENGYPATGENGQIRTFETDTNRIMQLIQQARNAYTTHPDSSLAMFEKALKQSQIIDFRRGTVKALNDLGVYYFHKDIFDKSEAFFLSAIQQSQGIDNDAAKADMWYNLGLCYGKQGMYDRSILIYKKALEYSQKAPDDPTLSGRIYSELGISYHYRGQYGVAAYYYYKVLEQLQPIEKANYTLVLDAYNRLGVIWLQLRLFDQAMYYYNQGEQVAVRFGDSTMYAKILVNKGVLYSDQGDKERAINTYLQVYALTQRIGYYAVQQTAANNLATCYLDEGRVKEALPYATTALQLSQRTDDIDNRINVHYVMGDIYYQLKQYKKAEQYLIPAMQEAQAKGMSGSTTNAHDVLASVYAATGQYVKAYEQEKSFAKMNDTLHSLANAQAVNTLEVKYKFAKKDKELTQKQLRIISQEDQLKEKNIWIGCISVSLLLLITTLIGIYRSNRHKQRLQAATINGLKQKQELDQLKARVKGEEEERNRLARELHDGIASQLWAVKLNVGNLCDRESTVIHSGELEEILQQLEDAAKDLRTTAHNLMPDTLLHDGLDVAISTLCAKTEKSTHLEIDFGMYGRVPRLDPYIELSIYRMVQELIQNTLKHARATQIFVQISCTSGLLNITVEDNGIGFNPASKAGSPGIGLANLYARVQALKGSVDFKSNKGNGTAVYLEFDLANLGVDLTGNKIQ